ncbi:MAG: hypothetical protein U1E51_26070, partial [Candidatus Binatia bacterium]|nr:hypothetical protein [Candidatus Binatia bacterium]
PGDFVAPAPWVWRSRDCETVKGSSWSRVAGLQTSQKRRMSITPEFIRLEIAKQTYEISLHADDERIADGLTVSQVEVAL